MARGGSRAFQTVLSPSFLRSAVFIHCARQMTHEHSIHLPPPKPEAGFKRSSFDTGSLVFLSTILGAGSKFLDRFFFLLIHLFLNFPRKSNLHRFFFFKVCPRLFEIGKEKNLEEVNVFQQLILMCYYNNLRLIIYIKKSF